jgi:3-deoxy-7-phosphoheptulonate synthase
MLIVMDRNASPQDVARVEEAARALGLVPHRLPGPDRVAVGVTGDTAGVSVAPFCDLPRVLDVIRIGKPYKLVSREMQPHDTIVEVKGHRIGGNHFAFIAGPCAVESREQLLSVAERVARAGIPFLRGGAVKPRTSPYSFQGLGNEGFRLLREASDRFGLAVVSEVVDAQSLEAAAGSVDLLQVGARNMQNTALLRLVARAGKPVLLKRGPSATLEDFLMSAEHLLAHGCHDVVLCERGIRTFSTHHRYTFDIGVIPEVRKLSHLPIIADPSHATGRSDMVPPLALAAIAAGANGIMIETHPEPARALSDGAQSLTPDQLEGLREHVEALLRYFGRRAPFLRETVG